jgi:hypothetical protein
MCAKKTLSLFFFFFLQVRPTQRSFSNRTVAAGVWRANYMTISAWASRTYGAVAVV